MNKNNFKVEGVVVLYNPEINILNNIKSYINKIEKLYIVDNSENINEKLIDRIKQISDKCIYINNNGNKGIAHALNVGANKAIINDANWLLTMDQDSSFEDDNFDSLLEFAYNIDSYKSIGIISPLHSTHLNDSKEEEVDVEEVLTVMTSGNLVNLDILKKIGFFKEYYFIDSVDTEYCLRLNINGYKILRYNKSILEHNLGELTIHKTIFNKELRLYNHNKIRKYYITRNKLLIVKEYFRYFPKLGLSYIKSVFGDLKNVIFHEEDKVEKIKYMLKGVYDFFTNKLGNIN